MERLAARPTAGVPQACRGWGETMAAYRFFDNGEVEWSAILEPHWRQTEQRMAAQSVVLCLQDTTKLDFNGRQAAGLAPLSYGMHLHPTYAVTPERVPLGVLDAWLRARASRDAQDKRGSLKESLRWIEGYERVAETASSRPHMRLVHVANREAGMLALKVRAQELGTPADCLIRSTHDRALPEGAKLWAATTEGAPLGEIAFTMSSRHGVKARQVRQHVWLRRIELPPGVGQSVAATCVVAREFDVPRGVKPIEWRMLTNREATTLLEAIELIDWYRARWEIEILFNVLKNGCRAEALQPGAIERLERALALFLVVAWRIAHLMHMGRSCPDLDAGPLFDVDEIRGVYLLTDIGSRPSAGSTRCCA
ncbi:IS4 family transposase ISAzo5 [Paraburkholderia humisilvae]|uniref:IS4 family transposase ISAzo5 n=1 Tax=Paraburkholderia humisilvae TaxID=627669 RepID=A0A6J5F4W9_9BURK|nr:IS4 family transposase ISAzo5 [Paraburkholderia humisilvae]